MKPLMQHTNQLSKHTMKQKTELEMLRNMLSDYNYGTSDQQEKAGEWLLCFHNKYGTVDPQHFIDLVR
jgi:hypothetical protein